MSLAARSAAAQRVAAGLRPTVVPLQPWATAAPSPLSPPPPVGLGPRTIAGSPAEPGIGRQSEQREAGGGEVAAAAWSLVWGAGLRACRCSWEVD